MTALSERLTFDNKKSHYTAVFLTAFCMTAIIMLPFIIMDKGFFLQYGDFNVQQYPFYIHAHDMIRSGRTGWDFKTDLGANFIGSYSFYNLGSPFFWLTLLLPSGAVPYMIGPLLALKISLCAVTGYAYIRCFTRRDDWAAIGGLLYAFSGFSLFNIFFNHFHEPMIVFPLLLLSLEQLMKEGRKGVFCFAVFVNALVNYFFFTGEVIFVIIYFIVRAASRNEWTIDPGKILRTAFEAVLGLLLSAFLLLPAVLTVLESPRVDTLLYGWNALLYNNSQRYLNIIEAFFFPPDLPARPNFTPDSGAKWGSIAAFLPVFGMTGVIAWLKSREGHWLKRLFITLLFFAFIPLLNSSFMLFNATYYARWFYMLTLITSLITVKAFTGGRMKLKSGIVWSAGITAAIALGIGLMLKKPGTTTSEAEYGLMANKLRFWIYVLIAVLSLAAATAVCILLKKRKHRTAVLTAFLSVVTVSCGMWIFFIAQGRTLSYSGKDYVIPYAIEGKKTLEMPDGEKEKAQTGEFRVDVHNGMDNIAMFWDMSCINAFHSIVPSSVIDFYDSVGIERVVATRPDTAHYAIRSLLSVKYLFDDAKDSSFGAIQSGAEESVFGEESQTDFFPTTAMPGWKYISTSTGYNLWKNEYYIPMGFTYDKYITESEYYTFAADDRANVMLQALVLSDEQALRYDGLLKHMDVDVVAVSKEQYYTDCEERAASACSDFLPGDDSFTAHITLSESDLVFFSVPEDSGWTAYVNGEKTQYEKVNVGFMAVLCPQGENEIVFRYETPGLSTGIIVSLISLLFLLLYVFLSVRPKPLDRLCRGFYAKLDGILAYKPLAHREEEEEE